MAEKTKHLGLPSGKPASSRWLGGREPRDTSAAQVRNGTIVPVYLHGDGTPVRRYNDKD